jgi:hypothetical protein
MILFLRATSLLVVLLASSAGGAAAQCMAIRRGGLPMDLFMARRSCEEARERFAKLFGARAPEVRVVVSREDAISAGITHGVVTIWFPSTDRWEEAAERLGFKHRDADAFVSDQWHNTLPHEIAHQLLVARLFPAGLAPDSMRYGTPLADWFDEAVAIWSEPDSMRERRMADLREIAPHVSLRDLLQWEHPAAHPDTADQGFILSRLKQNTHVCAPARCINPANTVDTFNIYTRVRPNGKMVIDTLREASPRVALTRELTEHYATAIGVLMYVSAKGGTAGVQELERRLRANWRDPDALVGLPGLPDTMDEVEEAWKNWVAMLPTPRRQ